MKLKLGVIMDPIATINYKKDSTFAMLLEAQDRGFEIFYFEQKDLFLQNGKAFGNSRLLKVFRDEKNRFEFGKSERIPLSNLQIILMRKDPPFDQEYICTTYLLEHAEHEGVRIINKPQSLRDANEKVFTGWFPQCCPSSIVTRDMNLLREFFNAEKNIICKPLYAMGGYSIFHLENEDSNASVVFEMLTERGTRFAMAQKFIPEINEGDKRILLIDGEPVDFALARIPKAGEVRGNLVAGAKGIAKPLTDRDRWICQQIAPTLREKGLFFVGIDVIGDYLTEINVTSPTGICELDEQCGLNIAGMMFDRLLKK